MSDARWGDLRPYGGGNAVTSARACTTSATGTTKIRATA
jgi:hypothetical protein